MDNRVQQAIETMGAQLHRRLTVAEIARGAGLSVAQLTRLFRRDTGKTPGSFLHKLRMERARVLLTRTSMSVRDVMIQVGLSDRSHFARNFYRQYGSTPRSLRLQSQKASAAP